MEFDIDCVIPIKFVRKIENTSTIMSELNRMQEYIRYYNYTKILSEKVILDYGHSCFKISNYCL